MAAPGITDLSTAVYLTEGGVEIYAPSPDFFGYDVTVFKTASHRIDGTRPVEGGTIITAPGRTGQPTNQGADRGRSRT